MKKPIVFILSIVSSFSTVAVNISSNGYGQAIILPYYTVNNNLNTLITVNNSTDLIKAVKVHFREGKEGKAVLTFNLYLSPQDIWAGVLVPAISTLPGHVGESSAKIISSDSSCVPFLNTTGQEFLPYEIEAESEDTNLERATEGFIEFIEMGVLDASSELGQAVLNYHPGGTSNCAALEEAFAGGQWSDDDEFQNEDVLPVTGGLSANSSIIDVQEGIVFAVDGLAFEKFFPEGAQFHTTVGDTRTPSLADAETTSVILHQGEALSSEWEHGYQSISALINKYQTEHNYDIAAYAAGGSELALTFPTKRFYSENEAPFDAESNETESGCISYDEAVYDRNGIGLCNDWTCLTKQEKITPAPPPTPTDFRFCNNVQVLQHVDDNFDGEVATGILGSRLFEYRDVYSFESGKMQLMFEQQTTSINDHTYTGIPVIAMSFQKYANAGAAQGLLAQYGNVFPVQFKREVTTD